MARKRPDKKYDFDQSPLYKLRSKKKLASVLNLPSLNDLNNLLRLENPYSKFRINIKDKMRPIQVPKGPLRPIHNRLFTLLGRIKRPSYLHSGTKGRSYISNAEMHLGQDVAYTLDIKKFYPSVTRAKVAAFFRDKMECSVDVSGILADLATCDGHIPTGSALSQILAYLSCKELFDDLFAASVVAKLKMTCYVDDLTFSGDKISKKWIYDYVKPTIKRFGLDSHKDKYYGPGQVKEITGVIIDGSTIKVCNRLHKSIHELLMQIALIDDALQLTDLYNTLLGKLSAAGQIDEKFKQQRKKIVKARKNGALA